MVNETNEGTVNRRGDDLFFDKYKNSYNNTRGIFFHISWKKDRESSCTSLILNYEN